MNDYSRKMVRVPTVNLLREQDIDKLPVLDVRNLGIDFGGLTAVDSFNITIGPTEISGLIGPNGAGKTTIFNLLTGVYQPTRGSVLVNGIDIKGMPRFRTSRTGSLPMSCSRSRLTVGTLTILREYSFIWLRPPFSS